MIMKEERGPECRPGQRSAISYQDALRDYRRQTQVVLPKTKQPADHDGAQQCDRSDWKPEHAKALGGMPQQPAAKILKKEKRPAKADPQTGQTDFALTHQRSGGAGGRVPEGTIQGFPDMAAQEGLLQGIRHEGCPRPTPSV